MCWSVLRCCSPELADERAPACVCALQELELYKNLQHLHVVTYIDHFFDKRCSTLYIFLEYVPGGSIASMLERCVCHAHHPFLYPCNITQRTRPHPRTYTHDTNMRACTHTCTNTHARCTPTKEYRAFLYSKKEMSTAHTRQALAHPYQA